MKYANKAKVFHQRCNHKGAGNVPTQHQPIKPDVHEFTLLAGGALAMMASTSGPSNKKTAKGTADASPDMTASGRISLVVNILSQSSTAKRCG